MAGLKVTVYNKDLERRGRIGAPQKVTATPAHNQVGEASVTFRADDRRAGDVLADGARLVLDYEGLEYPVMSGPVRSASSEGPGGQGFVTCTIQDDKRLLWNIRGYPVPGASESAQTSAYRTYTGDAETIVKDAIAENVARLPELAGRVVIAPNLHRGAVIPGGVKLRMHPLADRLFPAVEQAGLGVRVYQSGAQLVVDVYESRVYPRALSEAAGTLRNWKWTKTGPEVTRMVAGGQGEAEARVFRALADPALESVYRDVIEGFVDARSGQETAELDQSMREELEAGRPKAGLSLELSETKHFRYGAVEVGDLVTVKAGGLTITDVLRSASFEWTRAGGLVIVPAVGDIDETTNGSVLRAVAKLWRGFTDLKVR